MMWAKVELHLFFYTFRGYTVLTMTVYIGFIAVADVHLLKNLTPASPAPELLHAAHRHCNWSACLKKGSVIFFLVTHT